MAQAVSKYTTSRLSTLFSDPYLHDRFAAAERDTPPECMAVEPERPPVLTPGAAAELAEV